VAEAEVEKSIGRGAEKLWSRGAQSGGLAMIVIWRLLGSSTPGSSTQNEMLLARVWSVWTTEMLRMAKAASQ
jgi:amino acid permease